jgi:hypothetical protein
MKLKPGKAHCYGVGYTIVDGGPDYDGAQFRRDCRGCHDCKPDEYTKSHYKRKPNRPHHGQGGIDG